MHKFCKNFNKKVGLHNYVSIAVKTFKTQKVRIVERTEKS